MEELMRQIIEGGDIDERDANALYDQLLE